jgi:glycosyltransferase involved in cell wall biosynthesis
MRVLLITDWMRHPGGAERYVADLRRGLAAAGDEVRLLTSSAGSAHEGAADWIAWGSESPWLQSVVQIANPAAVAAVRRAVARFAPEVVLVNMFANHLSPAIFTAFGTAPVFVSATDFKLVCPTFAKLLPDGTICHEREGVACLRRGCVGVAHWLRDRPRYALLRRAARRAAGVLACSRYVQRELERNGLDSDVVPLPVEPPGPGFRRRPAAQPLFAFSGRLAAQKGIFELVRVFARLRAELPGVRLRLVGDGPDRAALERTIAGLGVAEAIELTGWLPRDAVESRLEDAWAAVAPTRGAEPLGMVALEAIVRGVPIVATDRGGFAETVEAELTGTLVSDGDEDALFAALRDIASRRRFPEQLADEAAVARLRAAHDPARHVAELRERFTAALAGADERRGAAGYGMP